MSFSVNVFNIVMVKKERLRINKDPFLKFLTVLVVRVHAKLNSFFFHIFYCHFENKKVFTRLSVYSIYICKLLLIINYIYIFKQFYNYICKLLFIINKCHLYNNHLAWNCFCVLFLTAMYFSVLYLTSTCFKKTSHSGILSCFRLCHICNFARVIR